MVENVLYHQANYYVRVSKHYFIHWMQSFCIRSYAQKKTSTQLSSFHTCPRVHVWAIPIDLISVRIIRANRKFHDCPSFGLNGIVTFNRKHFNRGCVPVQSVCERTNNTCKNHMRISIVLVNRHAAGQFDVRSKHSPMCGCYFTIYYNTQWNKISMNYDWEYSRNGIQTRIVNHKWITGDDLFTFMNRWFALKHN